MRASVRHQEDGNDALPDFRDEKHAMKKLLAIAILATGTLGLAADSASAGWLHNHLKCCKRKCGVKIKCTQYNAFSPYCCDTACGRIPVQGANCGRGCGTCSVDGGSFALGQLPEAGNMVFGMQQPMAPAYGQGMPAFAPNMMPTGIPAYGAGTTAYGLGR